MWHRSHWLKVNWQLLRGCCAIEEGEMAERKLRWREKAVGFCDGTNGEAGRWFVRAGRVGEKNWKGGRAKWEAGEAATANGVELAVRERWESGEKEGVCSGEASDSFTAGSGPLNDSLFLHDFTSWQSTGLLVAPLQLYHYLLALSLLRICETEVVNAEGLVPWLLGRGRGRERGRQIWDGAVAVKSKGF